MDKKCKYVAFKYLLEEKSKKKKGREINYEKYEMQSYLKSGSGISTLEAKHIFCLRSHSLDVAANYSNRYNSNACIKKCLDGHDSQFHLYKCPGLQPNVISCNNSVEYDEIYGSDVPKQISVMRMIYSAFEKRCEILSSSQHGEDPAGSQPSNRVDVEPGGQTGQNSESSNIRSCKQHCSNNT